MTNTVFPPLALVEGDRMAKLPLYAEKLSQEAKDRYLGKISTLGEWTLSLELLLATFAVQRLQLMPVIWCRTWS